MFDFKFPDVGEGIHEGKIVKWLVKEGDEVKADQAIVEVETDKAVVEIPAPKAGKILKLYHKETQVIKVGETLATIEIKNVVAYASGASAQRGEESGFASSERSELTKQRESTGVVGSLEPTAIGVMKAPSLANSGAVFGDHEAALPPQKEKNIHEEKKEIRSSEKKDFSKEPGAIGAIKSGIKSVKKYDLFGYIDHIPYAGMRKTVGDHMTQSVSKIPQVTHTDTADVTELWQFREKEKIKAKKEGIHLTFMPFFIRAAVNALKKHPYLNAACDEQNSEIILKKYYNIGIAVDTENGLMVPVLKGADKKDIFQIAKELQDLAEKARSRKINPMDLKGSTFTITNVGSTGSGEFFTPIINYPEAAILGIGLIKDQPAALNGKVVIRKVLYLSLTFDHRVIDGAEAARFMKTFMEQLGNLET